ncbi:MAG: helix-turn-helix domain-containing protein [Actinomycetota bacterium]
MSLVDRTKLGACIEGARATAGIKSREELAKRLEIVGVVVSPSALRDYERGTTVPNFEVMAGIVAVTGEDWSFFVKRSVEEPGSGSSRKAAEGGYLNVGQLGRDLVTTLATPIIYLMLTTPEHQRPVSIATAAAERQAPRPDARWGSCREPE